MKLKVIYYVVMLTVAAFLGGCSNNASGEKETDVNKNEQITVYTTIFPLENFTSLIGGDKVKVKSVYPPNVDAHSFEPTTKTMVDIAGADLFIYTGAGVEGFADKAVETLKDEDVKIIRAADGIELLKSTHEHEHAKMKKSMITNTSRVKKFMTMILLRAKKYTITNTLRMKMDTITVNMTLMFGLIQSALFNLRKILKMH
nr:zinc ABC transporter substrate-binding protein [Robertmurraya kyonggiensis]